MNRAKENIENPGYVRSDNKENKDDDASIALKRCVTSSDPEKNILVDKQLTQNDKNKAHNDKESDQKQAELDNPDSKNVKTANEVTDKKKRKNKQKAAKRNARKKNKKAALVAAQKVAENNPEPDQTAGVFEFGNEDNQGTSGMQQLPRNFDWDMPTNMNNLTEVEIELGLLIAEFLVFLER
ncbi:hypothetical protein ACKWTF_003827 [Chironomus riparius]